MNHLPFTDVGENDMLNTFENNNLSNDFTSYLCTNNDQLFNIDPDLNTFNNLNKQCQNYDTSLDFKSKFGSQNNIAILHSNICSSEKKLNDFTYYLDNLNVCFTFIGLCETWATRTNKDILNIPGYKHEQCIRSNKKRGEGSAYTL